MKSSIVTKKYSKDGKPLTGFTLIELIVVMAIFLFVIGAAVSIFISIVQHQREILSQQEILNQVSYVEEYMSKALRVAKTSTTNDDINCMNGNAGFVYLLTRHDLSSKIFNGIKFINQNDNNACEEFFLDNGILKVLENSSDDSHAVPITSDKLQINSIRFGINGSDGSDAGCQDLEICGATEADNLQPRVTIVLDINIQGNSLPKIIQTTVSQRNLNAK